MNAHHGVHGAALEGGPLHVHPWHVYTLYDGALQGCKHVYQCTYQTNVHPRAMNFTGSSGGGGGGVGLFQGVVIFHSKIDPPTVDTNVVVSCICT